MVRRHTKGLRGLRFFVDFVVDSFPGRPDQPPLKLRRSAEASAKAEGLRYDSREYHAAARLLKSENR